MPSRLDLVKVHFLQDTPLFGIIFPTGYECSMDETSARSFGKEWARIVGPGDEATKLMAPSSSIGRASPGMTDADLRMAIDKQGAVVVFDDEGAPTLSPAGIGREIQFEAGQYLVPEIDLPTGNSLTSPALGAVVLKFAGHADVTEDTGVISVKDDRHTLNGIAGRGFISRMGIDGNAPDADPDSEFKVHGYYVPEPEGSGESHTIMDTTIVRTTGSGIHLRGRHQFISFRAKTTNCEEYGVDMEGVHDSKNFAPGWNGKKGALRLSDCATPKFIAGDFFLGNEFTGIATVTYDKQGRAAMYASEVSGRMVIINGRNALTGTRYAMDGNLLHGINFKIDETLPASYTIVRPDLPDVDVSAMLYVEDADGNVISCPTLFYPDTVPSQADLDATPDYFIQLGTVTGDPTRIGPVRLNCAHNIVHRRGREGDGSYPAIVAFKKNVSPTPHLIEWDFVPGQQVLIPWDDANPPRHFAKCGTLVITKQKQFLPFGFLWITGLDLDNVATTFDLPAQLDVPPAGMKWAVQVWPT